MILKSVILGIITSVAVYGFLYWKNKNSNNSINLIPVVVSGALVWFFSGMYFNSISNSTLLPPNSVIHKYDQQIELNSTDTGLSGGDNSYRLAKTGSIQLPSENPDVFLDLME